MPYSLGPNGEIYDENGKLVSAAGAKLPPEAPTGNLQVPSQGGSGASFKGGGSQSGASSGSSGKSQGGGQSSIPQTLTDLSKLIARGRGGGANAGAVYDASGNLVTSDSNLTAQAAAGSGATMMPGGGVRDASGNVFDSSANLTAQDVGGAGATMPGGGGAAGGGMSPQMSAGLGALSSIGQNLGSAIAGSVGSWKMQPSAIPDPSSFARNQPQYNLERKQII